MRCKIFRAISGNINDVSTLSKTITVLNEYGVSTDIALLGAGYLSEKNIDDLYYANIDFVARLPEKLKTIYDNIVEQGNHDELLNKNGLCLYKFLTTSVELVPPKPNELLRKQSK